MREGGSPSRGNRRIRSRERHAPYNRDSGRFSRETNNLCKNCKRPGHFARDCPNDPMCNNCGLPGHIASECTSKSLCWNCREAGHVANQCTKDPLCHTCGKVGHFARDCTSPLLPPGDTRLCNNCYKQGHLASECTNDKACGKCRKTGHLARECTNSPVCNLCNISGHVARQCPKADLLDERGPPRYSDIIFRPYNQPQHFTRDVTDIIICHNCGGRGHLAYECPSDRLISRDMRRR